MIWIKYIILFVLTHTACSFANGQKVTKPDKNFMILTPQNNIIKAYKTMINGINFMIAVEDIHNSLYISTSDQKFRLGDSTIIGRPLESFKNKKEIKLIRGWGHYLKIDNQWYAAFDWKKVSDTSKVLFCISVSILNRK